MLTFQKLSNPGSVSQTPQVSMGRPSITCFAQQPKTSCKNLPVNFFLSPHEYRKQLLSMGRNRKVNQEEPFFLNVMELQDFNQEAYKTLKKRHQKGRLKFQIAKQEEQKAAAKSKLASTHQSCKSCECCCCDQFCRQCLFQQRKSSAHPYRVQVQAQYLYQRLQKQGLSKARLELDCCERTDREQKMQRGQQLVKTSHLKMQLKKQQELQEKHRREIRQAILTDLKFDRNKDVMLTNKYNVNSTWVAKRQWGKTIVPSVPRLQKTCRVKSKPIHDPNRVEKIGKAKVVEEDLSLCCKKKEQMRQRREELQVLMEQHIKESYSQIRQSREKQLRAEKEKSLRMKQIVEEQKRLLRINKKKEFRPSEEEQANAFSRNS